MQSGKEAEIQGKDGILQARSEFENEMRETRRDLQGLERRLLTREEVLDKRLEGLEKRETSLSNREGAIEKKEHALDETEAESQRLVDEARRQLEFVAGISREEAKKTLMEEMVEEARHDSAKRIRLMEEQVKAEADREAKKMIALAIARLAGDFVTERTVSVVSLPNDEMKGRIIGREGRNIRALEAATGIDLIVDDTPESVIISGHNPIRREIARLSLETLIADGRIHPGRIEGSGSPLRTGGRRGHQGSRTEGRVRCRRSWHSSGVGQASRAAEVSLQLCAECPPAFDRDGVHLRYHGGRTRPEREAGAAGGHCFTISERPSTTRWKARTPLSAVSWRGNTASRRRS